MTGMRIATTLVQIALGTGFLVVLIDTVKQEVQLRRSRRS